MVVVELNYYVLLETSFFIYFKVVPYVMFRQTLIDVQLSGVFVFISQCFLKTEF